MSAYTFHGGEVGLGDEDLTRNDAKWGTLDARFADPRASV
jgi:hypothetical protein